MRILLMLAALALGAAAASGDTYWYAWEGDDYPENEGWFRAYGDENGFQQGGAVRTLANGAMTLDSLRHRQVYDYYGIYSISDPEPGELFVAEWRVRIDQTGDPYDNGIVIARDHVPGHVGAHFGYDSVRILYDNNLVFPIMPDVFHNFRLESADMEHYSFYIDGSLIHEGAFESESILHSYVAWGDGVQGLRSFATWDYVRFGVVPEPSTIVSFCAMIGLAVISISRYSKGGNQ